MATTLRRLPDEMIFHILSFLPRKSLARSKCVSKRWNTLFLDPQFRFFYWRNLKAGPVDTSADILLFPPNFYLKAKSSDGLLLDQTNSYLYSRCRVSCTQSYQYLEFPGPRRRSLCLAVEFIPSIRAVMLLSVHEYNRNEAALGFEVLHIGDPTIENISPTTTTYCWRSLKVPPPPSSLGKRKRSLNLCSLQQVPLFRAANDHGLVLFISKSGFGFCISANENSLDLQVDILDMVNESYLGHRALPAATNQLRLTEIQLLDWNGQLSINQVVNDDELHVFVLNNYKKEQNWTRRIFKHTSLKYPCRMKVICLDVAKSALFFSVPRGSNTGYYLCNIDINNGNVTTICFYPYPLMPEDAADVNSVLNPRRGA